MRTNYEQPGNKDSTAIDLGVSVVKAGADGKEKAVLLRRSSFRWICLVFIVLVGGGCGAWFVYEQRLEHQAEMGRLTKLLRSTGERVEALQRVQDRLEEAGAASSEVKEKLMKELKLGSEVHTAQADHTRAQAAVMMKKGLPTLAEHQAAADKAALKVSPTMQAKMVEEFRMKASFLVWATTPERDAAWRKSPRYGIEVTPELSDEVDNLEDIYEDGEVDTATFLTWLKGNITAGKYPPPVNSLGGIAGYLEDLTDEPSLFVEWEKRKHARSNAHQEAFRAAEETIAKIVAISDETAHSKDPTPTFKSVYAALVQFHLTEWLFPADDPFLDEGLGAEFFKVKDISEGEQDDDDGEDDLEMDEKDDDEAE